MLINVKQVKNAIKTAGMQASSDFIEGLNKYVSTKLDHIIKDAKNNNNKRIHIEDIEQTIQERI